MTKRICVLAFLAVATLGSTEVFAGSNGIKSINGNLTAAGDSGDFVFVVAGDNRPTAKGAPWPHVLRTIVSEIRLIHPDFVLWTGDTIYGYRDTSAELRTEYDEFLALAKQAEVPIFNAPGNHEIHGLKPCTDPEPERQFKELFGSLYGSFDYRGAHFIALDSEECGHTTADPAVQVIDGAQLEWLKQDLEANKNARAIFVFLHTEMTAASNDEERASHKPLGNSDDLRALFEKYPVKAVFQGHEHLFYQTAINGIQYFVAGGAGAPLYARTENGGFSHYLVVEMNGGQPAYNVVEPGRLFVEAGAAKDPAERLVWLVNATDIPLPVRRVETSVPASLGTCAQLTAEAVPVPVTITDCTTSGQKRNLTIAATGKVPRRSSVPINIHKR